MPPAARSIWWPFGGVISASPLLVKLDVTVVQYAFSLGSKFGMSSLLFNTTKEQN